MTNNWLTFKDIQPIIDDLSTKVDKKSLIVYHIKNKNDVDKMVGKIIQTSQQSEMQVKAFMGRLKIDRKSLSIKGIGDLIAHLCNKKIFNDSETKILRDSVKVRNYIIHHFYIELENNQLFKFEEIEFMLNSILYVLNQGIYIINNKIKDNNISED